MSYLTNAAKQSPHAIRRQSPQHVRSPASPHESGMYTTSYRTAYRDPMETPPPQRRTPSVTSGGVGSIHVSPSYGPASGSRTDSPPSLFVIHHNDTPTTPTTPYERLYPDLYADEMNEKKNTPTRDIPLVQSKQFLRSLICEYRGSKAHRDRVVEIMKSGYSHWRPVRGDGNCLYRSIISAFLEFVLQGGEAAEKICSLVQDHMNRISLPKEIQTVVFRFFCVAPPALSELEDYLQDRHVSDSLVHFLRIVVAENLEPITQRFGAEYLKEIYDNTPESTLTMGTEGNFLDLFVVSNTLDLPITVIQLDGSTYRFPTEDKEGLITLLFRPGHYDLLYKRQGEV